VKPKNDLQERIALNIKKLRYNENWTQEELASRLGVKRSTIAKYESCARTPNIYQLSQLAKVFGITVDALMR
jgi:transcriptional regulator with XRE-family HTH domain